MKNLFLILIIVSGYGCTGEPPNRGLNRVREKEWVRFLDHEARSLKLRPIEERTPVYVYKVDSLLENKEVLAGEVKKLVRSLLDFDETEVIRALDRYIDTIRVNRKRLRDKTPIQYEAV